jgi:F-type H+-transporting ATPase subunit delta
MSAPVLTARGRALDQALAAQTVDGAVAQDLLALARLLDANAYLRRALTEPSTPVEARQQVATALLANQVGAAALSVLHAAIEQSWPDEQALVRALERQGIRAVWIWADRDQRLGAVVDELFAFGQLVARTPQLRGALTDFTTDPKRRSALVRRLLQDKAAPQTVALAEHAAVTRYATFEGAIERDLDLAGQIKSTLVATATVATPLTDSQHARLVAALSARAGQPVVVEEVIDPAVIGGVRVDLGDEVIDGTMASRLAAARRHLT